MSHFSRLLTQYLDTTGKTNRQLEIDAGLSNAALRAYIVDDALPTQGNMTKLLAVLPDDWAAQMLRAYLLDHIPAAWLPRVQILIAGAPTLHVIVDAFRENIDWLTAAGASNQEIVDWLNMTCEFLRRPATDASAATAVYESPIAAEDPPDKAGATDDPRHPPRRISYRDPA